MDERVFEVHVCASCGAQMQLDGFGCPACGGIDSKTARFTVSRDALLAELDPRQLLIERTVYFGCVGQSGHYYWHRGSRGLPYKAGFNERESATPWGYKIDGGLFPKHSGLDFAEGVAHVVHQHGWTALAFTDRSVDRRPGSWSVYCIPATLDGVEALAIAREAFPPIFERYSFDVTLA
jgi:hypothetical protein